MPHPMTARAINPTMTIFFAVMVRYSREKEIPSHPRERGVITRPRPPPPLTGRNIKKPPLLLREGIGGWGNIMPSPPIHPPRRGEGYSGWLPRQQTTMRSLDHPLFLVVLCRAGVEGDRPDPFKGRLELDLLGGIVNLGHHLGPAGGVVGGFALLTQDEFALFPTAHGSACKRDRPGHWHRRPIGPSS